MHPYSASMTDRPKTIAWSAMGAAVVFLAIGLAIEVSQWDPPFWAAPPSAMATFGVFFTIYDRWLWRRSIGPIHFSSIPDLRGHWGGSISIQTGERRPEEGFGDMPCFVRIAQTWSMLRVDFETEFSRSRSSMASVAECEIHYEFTVRRKEGAVAPPGFKPHHGVARLDSVGDWESLDGDFYTDQDFQRSGRYHLDRLPPTTRADEWLAAEKADRRRDKRGAVRRRFGLLLALFRRSGRSD